jgi:hypothetical protein
MQSRALASVGLGFVALCSAGLLGIIWRTGVRVERELADFGSALPAPTELAFDARVGLSLFVGVCVVFSTVIHRHARAVPFLVLVGALELVLTVAYGFALWLPYRAPS